MRQLLAAAALPILAAFAAPATVAWPGRAPQPADQIGALGGNISGLAAAGTSSVWAVRDGPGALLRLERTPAGWVIAEGWGKGKGLRYRDGDGEPDAEGVAFVPGETSVYVAAERDNDKPNTSRNTILRYDPAGAGNLRAAQQWELTALVPQSGANTGLEGITWIPDEVFVGMGYRDASGAAYAPSDYPDHGRGLFAVAHEQSGSVYLVALRADGAVSLIGMFPSGLSALMELAWSETRQELWALCDNTCQGVAAVFRPGRGGFEPVAIVQPAAGTESINNEGFALLEPCSNGAITALWSDDSAAGGRVVRETTLPCAAIAPGTASASSTSPATATAPSGNTPSADTSPPSTTGERASDSDGLPIGLLLAGLAVLAFVGAGTGVLVRRRRR